MFMEVFKMNENKPSVNKKRVSKTQMALNVAKESKKLTKFTLILLAIVVACEAIIMPIALKNAGVSGEPGQQGLQGPKGEQGEAGAAGQQGLQGLPGADGKDALTPVENVVVR